jgi:hypothetical protein
VAARLFSYDFDRNAACGDDGVRKILKKKLHGAQYCRF